MSTLRRAVVLGGAGFVGSAIARALSGAGYDVEVIDALEPRTFADARRLAGVPGVRLIHADVVEVGDLAERLGASEIVVNAMGWTRHRDAEDDPALDLRLNLANHLHVLAAMPPGPRLIHLGSRHQFAGATGVIDDDTSFAPLDVQSIHKCAAEQHVALWARKTGGSALVLRPCNCIGPGQPIDDGDVGLIGGFLRDLMAGKTIEVFAGPRVRNVCLTTDVGEIVVRLANQRVDGYVPVNVPGVEVEVARLATALQAALGRGTIAYAPMPEAVARIELASGKFVGSALKQLLPDVVPATLEESISRTVAAP